MKETSSRLCSLDTLRGFDMLFIMGGSMLLASLVNIFPTPFFEALAEQTRHVGWNGLHFEDCIFPLFLFIAGISFPFSLEKQREIGRSESRNYRKIISRGLILVFLGFLYNGLLQFDFGNMRYASVLGRIGLAWMFGAIIFMNTRLTGRILWTAGLLMGYYLLMRYWPLDRPEGVDWFDPDGTLERFIDMHYLPGKQICGGDTYDPEGLLSTIPAVGTALLGMMTGSFVKRGGALSDGPRKALIMAVASVVLVGIGLLWAQVFPINKRMWTSSFVCVVGGISLVLFSIFYYIVDVRGCRGWTMFFRVIGMNSITIYLAQKFISFWATEEAIFGGLIGLLPENARSTVGCLGYLLLCWLLLYILYRQKIFLKV